ncbi:MAG: shikimate dehydrogenase [Gammaproteobacteria bacterium]|nr:shikimate dehydrogenase [Gammaproteobacteria bacterium]
MTDLYAVMGNPIAHSLSPRIHDWFAQQTGQDLRYEARLVAVDGFANAVAAFREEGGKGLNITVPFKQEAWKLANTRSPRAQRAGAVNTLVIGENDSLYGDTTDGVGLLRDLTVNLGLNLAGMDILLLGAGGAVRGVLEPLLAQGPRRLLIANRTAERAATLAADYRTLGAVEGCGFDDLAGQDFDLVINGTAAGLQDEVPAIPGTVLKRGGCGYDMMYGTEPTAFVRWCREQGAGRTADGLGMLVEQAAESFFLWRGVRPGTVPVIARLRGDGV